MSSREASSAKTSPSAAERKLHQTMDDIVNLLKTPGDHEAPFSLARAAQQQE